jgi:hypothetical protein
MGTLTAKQGSIIRLATKLIKAKISGKLNKETIITP